LSAAVVQGLFPAASAAPPLVLQHVAAAAQQQFCKHRVNAYIYVCIRASLQSAYVGLCVCGLLLEGQAAVGRPRHFGPRERRR
jgi:hypothetical protein